MALRLSTTADRQRPEGLGAKHLYLHPRRAPHRVKPKSPKHNTATLSYLHLPRLSHSRKTRNLREQLPCKRARHTPGIVAAELPPQCKLVYSQYTPQRTQPNYVTNQFPSCSRRAHLSHKRHVDQTCILWQKLFSLAYGIHCKYAGQAYSQ
jgi:hypothetical protein